MVSNKDLLEVIASGTKRGARLDVLCNGLARLVSRAEAFDLAGDDNWLGINLTLIEERLNEIVEIRDALLAAKNGEAA